MSVTFWAATAISIVIVSWFFYRVIVPKGWKERAVGYSITLFGVGLLSTGWGEVYRARKEHRLASQKRVPMFFPHRGHWQRLLHLSGMSTT